MVKKKIIGRFKFLSALFILELYKAEVANICLKNGMTERGKKKKNHHHAGLQQRDPDLSLGDAIYCHSGHLRNGCWCVADFHSFGKLQMFSRRVPKRKREAAKSTSSSCS